jgi:hypothetical protein
MAMGKTILGLDWTRMTGYAITIFLAVCAATLAGNAAWHSLNDRVSLNEIVIGMQAQEGKTLREGVHQFGQSIRKLELENLTQHSLIRETLTEIRADVKHLRNGD